MKTICRDIVSAVIISNDNKILMGKKHPGKGGVYANCWHIPGGGIENQETKMSALKREIQEEVGINISTYKISFLDDKGEGESTKISQLPGTHPGVHNVSGINLSENSSNSYNLTPAYHNH